jgi:hypothetical protein
MVKWENEKNVYILGAALGALGTTMSNEIIEAIRADWRMLSLHFLLLLHPFVVLFHLIPFRLCPIYTSPYRLMIHNHTASEHLGETPTTRAVKDQLKKLSTAPSSSTITTTVKKSGAGAGVKKARATAAKGKGKGKGKGEGKKRAADDDDDDNDSGDAEGGDKEGDEDEDEETMPVKKKKTVAVKKKVEDEDDGEV